MNACSTFAVRTLVAAISGCIAGVVVAAPQSPTVVAGQATFQQAGGTLTVTNAPGTIINWQSFSINRDEVVRFLQQNAGSQVLNRVTGIDPSVILGQLQSNGRVLLINPNGVLFGKGAQVDVAGLLVSTLQLKDTDFLSGRYKFNDTPGAGSVSNQGSIRTQSGGHVVLIAPKVENSGIIQSPEGHILLAAGRSVTLADPDKPAIQVEVTNRDNTAVNLGSLIAKNVTLYGGIVRNSGVIQATTAVVGENGKIRLQAKYDVENTGTLQANGVQGGDILIQAQEGVARVQGLVEAKASLPTVNADNMAKTDSLGKGGRIEILAPEITVDASVDASGTRGGGVILIGGQYQGGNSPVPTDWSENPALQRASLSLDNPYATAPSLTETAAAGSSTPSDPAQQSGTSSQNNPLLPARRLPTARTATIGANARIRSDGLEEGDGGIVVVWSDSTTVAKGDFSTQGGVLVGKGGLVEISSKGLLKFGAVVDTAAPQGKRGLLLLDPTNLTIGTGADVNGDGASGDDVSAGGVAVGDAGVNSFITAGQVSALLNTTDLVLAASNDINVNSAINKTAAVETSLTLTAGRNINLNANITSSNAKLNLTLNANHASASPVYPWPCCASEYPSGNAYATSGQFIDLNGGTLALGNTFFLISGGTTLKNLTTTTSSSGLLSVPFMGHATLDNVTLGTKLEVAGAATLDINNGLVMQNGEIALGRYGNMYWGWGVTVNVNGGGTQSIAGQGSIVAVQGWPGQSVSLRNTGGDLDIGANIHISSLRSNFTIGNAAYRLTNNGIIEANGGNVTVTGTDWINRGTLSATSGRLELAGSMLLDRQGQLQSSGGQIWLTGFLGNEEQRLTLSNTTGNLYLGDNAVIYRGEIEVENGSDARYIVGASWSAPAILDHVVLSAPLQIVGNGHAATIRNGLMLRGGVITIGDGSVASNTLFWDGTQEITGNGRIEFNGFGYYWGEYQAHLTGIGAAGSTLTIDSGITLAAVHGEGRVDGANGNRYNLINQGAIDSSVAGQSLVLDVDSSVAGGGTLSVANGGRLEIAGTFTTAALGTLQNQGGWLGLTGTLVNTGSTLTLDDSTGSFYLGNNALVRGGELSVAGGSASKYIVDAWWSTPGVLDGVTLSGALQITGNGHAATIRNGLTLNGGVITIGDASQSSYALNWDGSQTISGSGGRIEFKSAGLHVRDCDTWWGCAHLTGVGAPGTTLTIGPNVALVALNGQSKVDGVSGNRYNLINQGAIDSSVAGQSLVLDVDSSVAGGGTLSVANGGRLEIAGTFTTAALGTLQNQGGWLGLTGTLVNTGSTLTLDDTTGSFYLGNNALVRGGELSVAGGSTSKYMVDAGWSTPGVLDGVTLSGALQITGNGHAATIRNGLTLNGGVITIGDGSLASNTLFWDGTQGITGSGRIEFNSFNNYSPSYLTGIGAVGTTLTIGGGVTLAAVHGKGIVNGANGNRYNLINQGTIDSSVAGQSLVLDVDSSVAGGGTLSVANGGRLEIAGTFTTAALGTLQNQGGWLGLTGTLVNTGSTLTLDDTTGSFYLGDSAVVRGGELAVSGGSASRYIVDASTSFPARLDGITLSGVLQTRGHIHGVTIQNGLTLHGGVIRIGDGWSAGNRVFWDGTQSISGTGSIQFDAGTLSANITGLTDGSTLTFGQNVTIQNISGNASLDGYGNYINQGAIISAVPGQAVYLYPRGTLTNTGTLRATNGGTLVLQDTSAGWNLGTVNQGLIEIGSGSVVTTQGSSFTNFASGKISGSGTLDLGGAVLTNEGTIDPGVGAGHVGTLTLNGALAMHAGGKLHIDLAGTSNVDRLVVNGNAALDGNIEFAEVGGFYAELGAAFPEMLSVSGSNTGSLAYLPATDVVFVPVLSGGLGISSTITSVTRWATDSGGSWMTPENWTRGLPSALKDAVISRSGANPVVSIASSGAVAKSLWVDDALDISGQALTIGRGTINGNVSLANAASIITDGSIDPSGNKTLYWSGGAISGAGGLSFVNGASFGFSGNGDRIMNSPNLNFAFTDLTLPAGSLTLQQGGLTFNTTLHGQTSLLSGTTLQITGGTLTNNGPLNVSGLFGLYGGRLTGAGAINMTGGTIDLPANSTVNWQSTGQMSNSGTLNMSNRTITNPITNNGTISSAGGLVFTSQFTNAGTLNLSGGTTTFAGGYVQNGGALRLGSGAGTSANVVVGGSGFSLVGGTLSGSGSIAGDLTLSGGLLSVGFSPGSLTVNGNLNLSPTSVTQIELGGTTPGTGFDTITVTGTANLAGTLNVSSYGGYVPGAGSSYTFMNFASSTGAFSSTNLPAGWNMSMNSSSANLSLLMAGGASSSVLSSPLQALMQLQAMAGGGTSDPGALTSGAMSFDMARVTRSDVESSLMQQLFMLSAIPMPTAYEDMKVCR